MKTAAKPLVVLFAEADLTPPGPTPPLTKQALRLPSAPLFALPCKLLAAVGFIHPTLLQTGLVGSLRRVISVLLAGPERLKA
jgi:hypothetical protein